VLPTGVGNMEDKLHAYRLRPPHPRDLPPPKILPEERRPPQIERELVELELLELLPKPPHDLFVVVPVVLVLELVPKPRLLVNPLPAAFF